MNARLRDPRFWVVQALVVLIAAADWTGDDLAAQVHVVSLLTVMLFFVPVTYAALNFGFPSALATAIWCVVADLPIIFVHHTGTTRIEELLQLAAIVGVAVFVARHVDRAEAAERKYRALFEHSPEAVVLLDGGGRALDLNPAAVDLLGRAPAREILEAEAPFPLTRADGRRLWLEPLRTAVGDGLMQLELRDATEARARHDSLRAFARAVLAAQEEERRRLAQEIHDDTIQSVVLLCRRMDAVARAAPPAVASGIADLRVQAETTIQGLRRLTRALRPPVLDDLGLVASLRQVVDDFSQRTGVAARLDVTGDARRLAPEVELGVFRIAQEAVHNVEQHAHAHRLAVRLIVGPEAAVLGVADDGVGMAERAGPAGDHLGLVGMRERAQLLGGTLRIRSRPGRGVQLRLRVPA